MDIALIIAFILLGAIVGSFLNVCIDRLPLGKSIVSPPSYCDACQRRLAPVDLIPVISYLWLRRRCRSCGALIPSRVFWIEVGTGALFGFLYWYYMVHPTTPETVQLVITIFYSCIFIIILGIDLEHQLILNRIVYPTAIVALVLDISLHQPELLISAPPAFLSLPDVAARTVTGITGGATGFVLLLIPVLIFQGGMGWGDIKMDNCRWASRRVSPSVQDKGAEGCHSLRSVPLISNHSSYAFRERYPQLVSGAISVVGQE